MTDTSTVFVLLVMALTGQHHCGFCAEEKLPVDTSTLPPPVKRKVDFVKDIKPLFEANCYKCHGPEKQKSEFRLDVGADALKGGEHGQDILPGKSAQSPLIHYVAGLVEDMQMPPKGERLAVEQIGLLRAWIDQGVEWPEATSAKSKSKADHWTFKPAVRPAVPAVKNRTWIRNPIDAFILARLETERLPPSKEADRVTLIRRLCFDLTGLPPTPLEVEEFISDKRRDAYEKLVERLLASPRYGERWGRYWLDLVHYGESHGYDKDKVRGNSWPYRDYVIRAFNEDKPYSRFVQEQLAGDVLNPESWEGIVATGFIAAGPWDFVGHVELPITKTDGLIARYNDRDDMVMTTMSTFQSLTVHCARCHDHKFDPITQRDYYGLQAVFAGVDRADRPFDTDPKLFAQRKPLITEKARLEAKQRILNEIVAKVASPALEQLDARWKERKEELEKLPGPTKESPGNGYHSAIEQAPDAEKWVQVDLANQAAIDEVRLIPARPTDFPDTPGFGFPKRFRVEAADDESFKERTILADHTADDFRNPGDKPFVIALNGQRARFVRVTATRLWERTSDFVFALAELQVFSGTNNLALSTAVSALDSIEAGRWKKSNLVDNFDSRKSLVEPIEPPEIQAKRKALEDEVGKLKDERQRVVDSLLDEGTKSSLASVKARLSEINEKLDALPKPQYVYAAAHEFTAMGSFLPSNGLRPVHLLRRGDVKSPGELMSPSALPCVPGLKGQFEVGDPANEGSRRAALAKWITDSRNLITRRSIVNRVWQYHFGRGIVDTPNDFGHMGSLPTHPELLDWLAFWFLDNGESIKKLHTLILTSSVYRQVCQENAEGIRIDADNRLLGRMNRQRLDAEAFHDAVLEISGKIDLTVGGPSVRQFFFKDDHSPVYDYTRYDADDPGNYRRSVYRFIVRSVPDPFMEAIDCADPSLLTPKRNVTLTALQALATLNNQFVVRQCEHFAERLAKEASDLAAQINLAYQLTLHRSPTKEEAEKLTRYARKHGMPNVCRLIFNSSEFLFVE